MVASRPSLDVYVNAVLQRLDGTDYSAVLQTNGINPNQFYKGVLLIRRSTTHLDLKDGLATEFVDLVIQTIENEESRIDLFRMGEDFIASQYSGLKSRNGSIKPRKLYDGTLVHPENREFLAYYALVTQNPKLASDCRANVVQEILNIQEREENFTKYLERIGLKGLMSVTLGEKQGSPLVVLRLFDNVYQRKSGDVSLFDLDQERHLHPWGDFIKAPLAYWHDPKNREEAIYHLLSENFPDLKSNDEMVVLEGIMKIPNPIQASFENIGLRGCMYVLDSSPRKVLEAFNQAYMQKTGNQSLFEKLKFDGQNRIRR